MVSTSEGFSNNSPRPPMTQLKLNKPIARKSLCLFTNLLDVKNRTTIRQVRDAKSKRKAIKVGTIPCVFKPKKKVETRTLTNYHRLYLLASS